MAEKNPYSQYRETQIMTASQGKLIVLLYEGAVRFLEAALTAMDKKDFEKVNNSLLRAQDIITELALSINFDAGELASNMYSLYMFFNNQLLDANIKKESKNIIDVKEMMASLLEAWREIADKPSTSENAGGGVNIAG